MDYKKIIVVFLIGASIFSFYKYFSSLKEKHDLENNLVQTEKQVELLQVEKQNLLETIEKDKDDQQTLEEQGEALKNELEALRQRFDKQNTEFLEIQKDLEDLSSQVGILKAENTALREEKEALNKQLAEVTQEKDVLSSRLGSVSELKKAIRELRKRPASLITRIKKEIVKHRSDKNLKGNRGFILKSGKPTYPEIIKIEVDPLPLE